MSNTIDELEEFDTLLDSNFDPTSFANDLLIATNSVPTELDISTSIKRIKFDINNIDSQLGKISGEEHTKLVQEINSDNESKNLFKQLSTPLNQINTSFQRLDKDLIQPYNDAIKLQDALKKIHQTAYLMRGIDHFLSLVEKIEEITNAKNYDSTILKNHKNLISLSQLFLSLNTHLTNNPNIKSMKLIRDYEPIKKRKFSSLINSIQQALRQINEKNFDAPKSPMNYFSEADITSYFHSLYLLDSRILFDTVSIILNINATTSANLLSRSLSSKNLFKQTLQEVSLKALFISKIAKNLDINFKLNNQEINILSESSKKLKIKDFPLKFWSDVATKFEPKFNDFVNAGSITVQAFKKDLKALDKSIKDAVIKSDPNCEVKDNDERVLKMLHSISKLGTSL